MKVFLNVVLVVLCIAATVSQVEANSTKWVEDSFESFADGTLDSSGQNIYVSRDGKIRTIYKYDLNQDGFLDLYFGNTHDIQLLVSPTLCRVGKDRKMKQSDLGVLGSNHVRAADLNLDGYPDLVFSIENTGLQTTRRFVWIVYGGADGWPSRRSTGALTSTSTLDISIADINADGWPDIVVVNGDYQIADVQPPKRICVYLGGKNGFSVTRYVNLGENVHIGGARKLAAGDFNGDKAKDIAVLNVSRGQIQVFLSNRDTENIESNTISLPSRNALYINAADLDLDGKVDLVVGTRDDKSYIIRGKGKGKWHKAKEFSSAPASHISVGYLDSDKYPDLVLTYLDAGTASLASVAGALDTGPSVIQILWGGKNGYSDSESMEVKAKFASATAIGDLDGDGNSDLAVAISQGQESYTAGSLVYFGKGSRGFELSDKTVSTDGASDVAIISDTAKVQGSIVFSNSVNGTMNEKIPTYVYWGRENGFDPADRWEIPGQSSHQASAADLNADGFVDLLVAFTVHGGEGALSNPIVGTNIFWGDKDGFDIDKRRTILKDPRKYYINIADLNKDGFLDIILGGSMHMSFGPDKNQPPNIMIYYGSKSGIDPERYTIIDSERSDGVVIADFDKDSWLDIAVTNSSENCARIFWGSHYGFQAKKPTSLDVTGAFAIETADLNSDGFLDLIVGSWVDQAHRLLDMGNFIFWGRPDGFKQYDNQWLECKATESPCVADFDGDGFLDIFFPVYHGQTEREAVPSYLYWGSANGFDLRQKRLIICNSACGAFAGDFDKDGLIDLAIDCHTEDGNHRIDSMVLYNDGNRFFNPKIQWLPTLGCHYMYCHDRGNIYDRTDRQKYVSSVFRWQKSFVSGKLEYVAEVPEGTRLIFAVRSSVDEDSLKNKDWEIVRADSFTIGANHRCLQYKAVFESDNGDRFPTLDKVVIDLGADWDHIKLSQKQGLMGAKSKDSSKGNKKFNLTRSEKYRVQINGKERDVSLAKYDPPFLHLRLLKSKDEADTTTPEGAVLSLWSSKWRDKNWYLSTHDEGAQKYLAILNRKTGGNVLQEHKKNRPLAHPIEGPPYSKLMYKICINNNGKEYAIIQERKYYGGGGGNFSTGNIVLVKEKDAWKISFDLQSDPIVALTQKSYEEVQEILTARSHK